MGKRSCTILKALGRLKNPNRRRSEGERQMSENAVVLEMNPSSENENGAGSSSRSSSKPRAGLAGEHEARECVHVGW